MLVKTYSFLAPVKCVSYILSYVFFRYKIYPFGSRKGYCGKLLGKTPVGKMLEFFTVTPPPSPPHHRYCEEEIKVSFLCFYKGSPQIKCLSLVKVVSIANKGERNKVVAVG